MSVKSLRNQLLAAIAMMLVATIALGSSTYAWFAMNTTVTAGEMSISASASNPVLQIKASGIAGDYGTTANVAASAEELYLVTPGSLATTTLTWAYAYSTVATDAQVNNVTTSLTLNGTADANGTKVLAGSDASGNNHNYVLQQDWTMKAAANGEDATDLTVSKVTFNKGSNTIAASGRLLVKYGEAYQLFKVDVNAVTGEVTAAEEGSSDALIETMVAGTEYTVSTYFYFDGTDTSAYTANATNLTGITANIEFSVDAP